MPLPVFLIRMGGGGIHTESTRHIGPWMAYCTCPGWLWWWRIWWNEDWQGKPNYSEKTCPSATLSTTNPTWPAPGSNPGRRGGKPATNRLSYGAACLFLLVYNAVAGRSPTVLSPIRLKLFYLCILFSSLHDRLCVFLGFSWYIYMCWSAAINCSAGLACFAKISSCGSRRNVINRVSRVPE
jgi:hypothetical protein